MHFLTFQGLVVGASIIMGCAALLLVTAVVQKALSSTKAGPGDHGGRKDDNNVLEPTEHTESTRGARSHSAIPADQVESRLAQPLPLSFKLPFHVSFFENVPFLSRFLCVVWLVTFGPIVLVVRLSWMLIVCAIGGPLMVSRPWVCGYFLRIVTKGGDNPLDETKPVVFLTNHHVTHDVGVLCHAAKMRFGLQPKIMTHPKVIDSPFQKLIFGSQRDQLFFTTRQTKGQERTSFFEIFCDWVRCSSSTGNQSPEKRQSLVIAPAGMTTHQRFITPMHWRYFANPDVIKVLVNVDGNNPFGVKTRNLSGGSIAGEALNLMMPWNTYEVTFHLDVIPNGESNDLVSCQEDVDRLVAKVYRDHHGKEFAAGWTQKMRRNIDNYLNSGRHTQVYLKHGKGKAPLDDIDESCSEVFTDSMRTVPCTKMIQTSAISSTSGEAVDDIDDSCSEVFIDSLRTVPFTKRIQTSAISSTSSGENDNEDFNESTKIVTSTLIDNEDLFKNFERPRTNDEIVVVNPETMADEILAAVYEIPMAYTKVNRFDAFESNILVSCQRALNSRVVDIIATTLHYFLLEKNLILFALLIFGSGIWSTQLMLFAHMTALAHIWLLLLKVVIKRPRPVWLPDRFGVRSGVNDLQCDASFPSGHTGFLTLLAAVAFHEQALFSVMTRVLLAVFAGITGVGRVYTGAHFASDVFAGAFYSVVFVSVFYASDGNQHLLYRTTNRDLDFQVKVTLVLVSVQLVAILLTSCLCGGSSPLVRSAFKQNNLQKLSGSARKKLQGSDMPLDNTVATFAPFLAVSAVSFWTPPLLSAVHVRNQLLPSANVSSAIRFFGSLAALAFISIFVLPLRKLVDVKLKSNRFISMLALVVIYMCTLIFTTFYCHFLIEGMVVLTDG